MQCSSDLINKSGPGCIGKSWEPGIEEYCLNDGTPNRVWSIGPTTELIDDSLQMHASRSLLGTDALDNALYGIHGLRFIPAVAR